MKAARRPPHKPGLYLRVYGYTFITDVDVGVSFILLPILGVKSPQNPYFGGVNRRFQA